MARVELRGVAQRYHDGFELGPIDLDLPERSLTVLLGPSGSGKTTLLRMVAGLEPTRAGSVRIGARDVSREPAERRGVGLVFQDGALFPHLDVMRNVGFGVRDAARVDEMLALVGLRDLAHRRVARLSGGERQRVALARALAPRPQVLLLDEPLASLDRNLREELRVAIRRIHDELGLTTLLVTHDRDEALHLADRLVLMREGRIVEQGEPRRMFREPCTAFAARFLGAGSVVRGRLVRPDAVRVGGDQQATVESVRFAGFHEEVTMRLASGERVEARWPVGTAPSPGASMGVGWEEGALLE